MVNERKLNHSLDSLMLGCLRFLIGNRAVILVQGAATAYAQIVLPNGGIGSRSSTNVHIASTLQRQQLF
jgi:hypothetical protein